MPTLTAVPHGTTRGKTTMDDDNTNTGGEGGTHHTDDTDDTAALSRSLAWTLIDITRTLLVDPDDEDTLHTDDLTLAADLAALLAEFVAGTTWHNYAAARAASGRTTPHPEPHIPTGARLTAIRRAVRKAGELYRDTAQTAPDGPTPPASPASRAA